MGHKFYRHWKGPHSFSKQTSTQVPIYDSIADNIDTAEESGSGLYEDDTEWEEEEGSGSGDAEVNIELQRPGDIPQKTEPAKATKSLLSENLPKSKHM